MRKYTLNTGKDTHLVMLLATCMIIVLPATTKADTLLGAYFSTSSWSSDFSGNISNDGPAIDLNDELNITDEDSNLFSFVLEHPMPGIPNIKVQRTDLDTTSSSVPSSDISFGGVIYPSDNQLTSQLDLGHTNYILYYEVLDNWLSIDLGITMMNFDGSIRLQASNLTSLVVLDDYIPAAYTKLQFDLPLTGAYTGVEASKSNMGDNSISDINIYLGWESDSNLGMEFGYKRFGVDWQDFDSSNGDLEFDGYYVSVTFHF